MGPRPGCVRGAAPGARRSFASGIEAPRCGFVGERSRVILLNRNGAPVEVAPSGIVRNSVIRGFMWCKLKSAVTAQWAVGGMALYKRR